VIVARFERGKVLLETGIRTDGFAADGRCIVRVAGTACESDLEARLASIIEANLDWDAKAAASSRNKISEAETEARRDFGKSMRPEPRSGSVAADVVLAVQCDGAAGGNHGSREDAVVIAEEELRAETEASLEGEPTRVAWAERRWKRWKLMPTLAPSFAQTPVLENTALNTVPEPLHADSFASSGTFVTVPPRPLGATRTYRPFSSLGFATRFGLAGTGFDVATPVATKFNLRVGTDFFNYRTTFQEEGDRQQDVA
jgi:hypothetical protein